MEINEKEKMEKDVDALSLEETMTRLEEIVSVLGDGECTLEQSFALYEQGMKLLKAGSGKLDRVEKKMLAISEEGEIDEFYGGTEGTR